MYQFLINKCHVPKEEIKLFHHLQKMHGLSDTVKQIKKSDIEFLIIPDASTNDTKEIKELLNMGKKVLILDHHLSQDENLKTVYKDNRGKIIGVIVNNQLGDRSKALSGVGVTYKFLSYLMEDELVQYLDLVAIGNIADSMVINDKELRYFVDKGLKNINNPLIKEYIADAKLDINNVTPLDVSFNIANYINGTIRFGSQEEKENLFRALIGEEEDIEYKPRKSKNNPNPQVEIQSLQKAMVRISKLVKSRQDNAKKKHVKLCQEYIEKNNLNDNKVIVVIDEDRKLIDKRLTGLIAMNICDIYKKSVVILSKSSKTNEYIGSMRGYGVDDFKSILESTEIIKCQGHSMASGVQVDTKDIPRLIKRINRAMEDIEVEDTGIIVDCELDLKTLTEKDMNSILDMGSIWNQHCPKPCFLIKGIEVDTSKVRIPYQTLMTFNAEGFDFKKEFCSKVFQDSFLHRGEIKWGHCKLSCNIVCEIGFDDYRGKPCLLIKDAETTIISTKKDNNIPF